MNERGWLLAGPFFVPKVWEGSVGLQQVEAAGTSPVTVAQAKAHCGIESSEWDSMLSGFIAAATAHAEMFLNKAIGAQDWLLTLDRFADDIELTLGPVTGVASVTYRDVGRVERVLDSEVYILDLVSSPQRIVRDPDQSWPATADVPNAVSIRFTTGYATAPAPVCQAILMLVGFWWASREVVSIGNITSTLPFGFEALLRPYRRVVI